MATQAFSGLTPAPPLHVHTHDPSDAAAHPVATVEATEATCLTVAPVSYGTAACDEGSSSELYGAADRASGSSRCSVASSHRRRSFTACPPGTDFPEDDDGFCARLELRRAQESELAGVAKLQATFAPWWASWRLTLGLLKLFYPTLVNNLLFFVNQTVIMVAIGNRVGASTLGQVSLGLTVANVSGVALGIGMSNALDTLVPQAFGRNPRGPEVAEWLQTGLLLSGAICVPVAVAWVLAAPAVMTALFGAALGGGAAQFLAGAVPFLFLQTFADCVEKTLLGQQRGDIPMRAGVVAAVSCVGFAYLFISPAAGVFGAAHVLSASAATTLLTLLGLAWWDRGSTFVGAAGVWPLSRRALAWTRVRRYVAVAVPALTALLVEWWAFEVYMLFAATIGDTAVVAFAVRNNVSLVLLSVPISMATAIGTLVGEALGARRPTVAEAYARCGFWLTVLMASLLGVLLYFFVDGVYACYTSSPAVLATLHGLLWAQILVSWLDAVQTSLQGIFRGAGRQDQLATCVTIALWAVGVPAAWLLLHNAHWGLAGLLIGCALGVGLLLPMQSLLMRGWDWHALAAAAAEEITSNKGSESDSEVSTWSSQPDEDVELSCVSAAVSPEKSGLCIV